LTCDQSLIVLGPLGVGDAVGVLPAVAVGETPPVAVAVAPGVVVTVAEATGVTDAPSSRKTIDGLLHQCSFVSASSDGVGVAVVPEELPPNGPVQDARKILDNIRPTTANNHVHLPAPPGRCTTSDKNLNIII